MAPVIRIDDEVWTWLKKHARPLEDTPNSVLRRIAGIDAPVRPPAAAPVVKLNAKARAHFVEPPRSNDATIAHHPAPRRKKRVTGEWLNRAFHIGAQHALYHKYGTVFERLTEFPGILCDAQGYVRYDNEKQFRADAALSIGDKVNVPGGLSSHPRYARFPATAAE